MSRRKKESVLDDLFQVLLKTPWWVGPILAAVVFVFIRFIVPYILGHVGSKPDDPLAKGLSAGLSPLLSMLAPLGCLVVLGIWGIAEVTKFRNRRRLDEQTGLASIDQISPQAFEELVAEYYRREGYQAQVTGDAAGDGGIDVVLRRDGKTTLVQCKHWKDRPVGVKVVRELLGVVQKERADQGIVVTSSTFTEDAAECAENTCISLVEGDELEEMIRSVQRTPRIPATARPVSIALSAERPRPASTPAPQGAPSCPRCGSPMALRTAKKGASAGSQFWGCTQYPGCKGTRPMAD